MLGITLSLASHPSHQQLTACFTGFASLDDVIPWEEVDEDLPDPGGHLVGGRGAEVHVEHSCAGCDGPQATRRLANMMEVSYCLFGGSFMHLSLMYYLF